MSRTRVPLSIREAVIFRDGGVCYICNCSLNRYEITLDHIVPRFYGGKNTFDNLKVCCHDCNRLKSAYPCTDNNIRLIRKVRGITD